MKPTRSFSPFGSDGPKVLLFGKETGDWNTTRFQQEGDHLRIPGLYFRLNELAKNHHFSSIAIPTPTDCNTRICHPDDFIVNIQNGIGSVVLRRGVRADGVVLPHGSTGAIASADCPTIMAYCPVMKIVIVAHGGCRSLIFDPSVVGEIVKVAKAYSFCKIKVFFTCGISGRSYTRLDHVRFVSDKFGADCVIGECGIDLKKIATRQFEKFNVNEIVADLIDTHSDTNQDGEYLWHSYRRAKPEEKTNRNFVLVINK